MLCHGLHIIRKNCWPESWVDILWQAPHEVKSQKDIVKDDGYPQSAVFKHKNRKISGRKKCRGE